MAIRPIAVTGSSAPVSGEPVASTCGARVRRAVELRRPRMRVFLLVTALLLPLLLTAVFA